jgi:cytochrome c oxidase assembly protein subunit 15
VIDVSRNNRAGSLGPTAGFLAVAIFAQVSIGIITLVGAAPLGFALMHQAMALVVLTAATLHAARAVAARAASSLSSHGHP